MLFRFQYIKNLKKDFLEYVVYTYTYAFLVQCSHVNSKIFMLIINYEYIPFILYTCLMYLIENINGTLLWNLRIKSQLWPLVSSWLIKGQQKPNSNPNFPLSKMLPPCRGPFIARCKFAAHVGTNKFITFSKSSSDPMKDEFIKTTWISDRSLAQNFENKRIFECCKKCGLELFS